MMTYQYILLQIVRITLNYRFFGEGLLAFLRRPLVVYPLIYVCGCNVVYEVVEKNFDKM